MSVEAELNKIKGLIGTEIFLSDWTQVTQDQINRFADCTEDHQWIHVDLEKAAKGPFGDNCPRISDAVPPAFLQLPDTRTVPERENVGKLRAK